VDVNRVSLLVAVMEKRLGIHLLNQDIFLNLTGGIRVEEPGADLGVIASITSSVKNQPIALDWVIFGEVGLSGEVRGINRSEVRVKEAVRLGFQHVLLPRQNREKMKGIKGIDLIGVGSVQEAIGRLF